MHVPTENTGLALASTSATERTKRKNGTVGTIARRIDQSRLRIARTDSEVILNIISVNDAMLAAVRTLVTRIASKYANERSDAKYDRKPKNKTGTFSNEKTDDIVRPFSMTKIATSPKRQFDINQDKK
jgi:hypothetical protein